MRKKLILTIISILSVLTLQAVPALRTKKKFTLKDGSIIELTLRGDEFFSYYTDEEGNPCQLLDGQIKMLTKDEVTTTWTTLRRQHTEKAKRRYGRRGAQSIGESSSVTSGNVRGLVILLQYPDMKFVTPDVQQTYQRFFNEEGYHDSGMGGSVRDYFIAQSYGKLKIDFDVVGPYTTSRNMAYYGAPYKDPNGVVRSDIHPIQMAAEAVDAASKDVEFCNYDWNNDGEVDQVFIVYAGYAQSQNADENTIWPHESCLRYEKAERMYNGVTIDTYACSSELNGNTGSDMDGIGTACHEFSHCLGLPDMYDTSEEGSNFGMSYWDLMDSGSYNEKSRMPAGYTSYERWFAGWLEPVELNSMTRIKDMQPLTTTPEAYILYNEKNKNEYYLLENRQPVGFDAGLDGHGLLILHVDYSELAWYENNLNTIANHQRMTIIPADNTYANSEKSLAGDPWPGITNNTMLTNYTTPAATLYNVNKDGQKLMSKPIDNIIEDVQNNTVSFVACRPELDVPAPNEACVVDGGFTISWPSVAGATGYEVEMFTKNKAPKKPELALVREETFSKCYSKTTGFTDISSKFNDYGLKGSWSGSRLYTSPKLLKIGTSTVSGFVKTPRWDVPESNDITIVLGADVVKDGQTVKGTAEVSYANYGDLISNALRKNINFEIKGNEKIVLHYKDVSKELFWLTITPATQMYLNYLAIYDGIWTEEQLGLNRSSVKRKAASETVSYITETNSYTFRGVDADKRYIYRVRALGEDNTFSLWSQENTFEFPEEVIDGINTVKREKTIENNEDIYDLSGRKVNSQKPKGIYIINRKKVVVN